MEKSAFVFSTELHKVLIGYFPADLADLIFNKSQDFQGANLQEANFKGAYLQGANFTNANMGDLA